LRPLAVESVAAAFSRWDNLAHFDLEGQPFKIAFHMARGSHEVMRHGHSAKAAILSPSEPVPAPQLTVSSRDTIAWMVRLGEVLRFDLFAPLAQQIVA